MDEKNIQENNVVLMINNASILTNFSIGQEPNKCYMNRAPLTGPIKNHGIN